LKIEPVIDTIIIIISGGW